VRAPGRPEPATLDPLRLLDEIRTMQHHLAALASGGTPHLVTHRDADLDEFLRGLATAWRDGDARPTHRATPKPQRDWRTRADPFDAVWPQLRGWLAVAPDRTAVDLLTQLQQENAGVFPDTQLRTLQRRVKAWRAGHARELVFGDPDLLRAANAHLAVTAPAAPGTIPGTAGGNIPI